MNRINVINQKLDNVGREEIIARVDSTIKNGGSLSIATVNPEFIVMSTRNPGFARTLQGFSLRIADGVGITLISRLFFQGKFKARITGVDLVRRLTELAHRRQYRIMFFGSTDETARTACRRIKQEYPNISLTCYGGGAIDPDRVTADVCRTIKAYHPNILVVGLGAPKQEYFIANYQKWLGIPVAIGAGGTIDFMAGTVRRAPHIMRRLGFEWLWRLYVEPRRWHRISNAIFVFPWLYIKWLLTRRFDINTIK